MTTIKEYKIQIQELIDDFPDAHYKELLEEMIDLATTARDAWDDEHPDD